MKKSMRAAAVIVAAAMMAMPLAGCTKKDSGSSDTIKIGGLAPLTGETAQYGTAVNNAVKIAVDEINKKGGVLGKNIEYICYDEKGDSQEAVTAYDRLVGDKVVALIGDVTSKPCKAVAQKAVEDNMPMLTPSGTQEDITEVGGNVFRACFIDPYQGQLMATYASQKLGAKTAAILYDSADTYSTGIADAFEAAAKSLNITITNK
ncbi:MAG: ABC transporter substrate-binding protein, partial [Clostridiales bacterium]|nr:ABC transporter substrate-binding protein [Clostridiales bacterium]